MKILILSLISLFISFAGFSKEVVVEMLNKREDGQKMVFSEDVVKVDVGDTVKWLASDKGHNVEFVGGPEGVSLPRLISVAAAYDWFLDFMVVRFSVLEFASSCAA